MAKGFKTGGRQKGTLNKTTLLNREKLQKIFDEEIESGRFMQALFMLKTKDYANVMLKLCSYLLPKANSDNTAEIPPEELEVKRRLFKYTPTAEKEEVERHRAENPDEAELAALIYPKKKNEEAASGEEEQKPKVSRREIRFPLATEEEIAQLGREVDDVIFSKLILWNEKNIEKWALEDEEMMESHKNR